VDVSPELGGFCPSNVNFVVFSAFFRYGASQLRFAAGLHHPGRLSFRWPPKKDFAMQNLSRRSAGRLVLLAAAFPLVKSLPSVAAETPLAIQGYDPVAYFTDGKPTRGIPEYEYEWDEHRYRFASSEHRELFKADPVRYAPQFGNYCAMALSQGKIVVANPENWLVSDNKLYVFGSPAPKGPELFKKDIADNITKANQNRSILPKD
jgi:YHS domain-containing protein